jgi:hypothetical protein
VVPRIAIFFPPKKLPSPHIPQERRSPQLFFPKKNIPAYTERRSRAASVQLCRHAGHCDLLPGDPMISRSRSSTARTPSGHGSKANGNGTAVRDSILSSPSTTRTSQPVRTEVRCRIHPARMQNPGMVETVPNPPIGSIYLFRLLVGCSSRRFSYVLIRCL